MWPVVMCHRNLNGTKLTKQKKHSWECFFIVPWLRLRLTLDIFKAGMADIFAFHHIHHIF